ncbi:hypothetical protein KSP40_PGU012189 [Platanthera guangdongensis]|uniref:Uncharacterized protein n=1 Tax=Platanthera guangdongensis TaxID=2320717 RepID=A0ABR2M5Q4_9ASPA
MGTGPHATQIRGEGLTSAFYNRYSRAEEVNKASPRHEGKAISGTEILDFARIHLALATRQQARIYCFSPPNAVSFASPITSRYLSSYYSSFSSTTSTSYASNTTLSSSSSFASRRFPSPLPAIHRPSTPSTFAAVAAAGLNASRALCTTTRSLSVSFQGESFFYQTSKAKDASPVPAQKLSSDRRRPSTPVKNSNAGTIDNSENSKPMDHHHLWPAAKSRQSNLLNKSLDSSVERNDLLFTIQLLCSLCCYVGGVTLSFTILLQSTYYSEI